jgi:hypothetical protein
MIMGDTDPDVCCLIELDQGFLHSGYFNQIEVLISARYLNYNIADNYGPESRFSDLICHRGKSNGFLSKVPLHFTYQYFQHGTKRLVYRLQLTQSLALFFGHFSLNRRTRAKQMLEVREFLFGEAGEVIVFEDLNILTGLERLLSSLNHWLVIFRRSINKLSHNFDPIGSKRALGRVDNVFHPQAY